MSTSPPGLSQKGRAILEKQFLQSVATMDLKQISKCLEKGINPNILSPDNQVAALHIAAIRGDIILAKRLMMCPDLDINIRTGDGYTPLHIACVFGKRKFVKMLIRKKTNVNLSDLMGRTALHISVMTNSLQLVKELVQNKANVNKIDSFESTPLSLALIDNPDLLIAEFLLENGADCNLKRGNHLHLFLETVLYCYNIDLIDYVKLLLAQGIDINMKDPITGRNCLHLVALTGYAPLARILLRNGADLKAIDRSRRTPLMIAKDHENKEIISLFDDKNVMTTIGDDDDDDDGDSGGGGRGGVGTEWDSGGARTAIERIPVGWGSGRGRTDIEEIAEGLSSAAGRNEFGGISEGWGSGGRKMEVGAGRGRKTEVLGEVSDGWGSGRREMQVERVSPGRGSGGRKTEVGEVSGGWGGGGREMEPESVGTARGRGRKEIEVEGIAGGWKDRGKGVREVRGIGAKERRGGERLGGKLSDGRGRIGGGANISGEGSKVRAVSGGEARKEVGKGRKGAKSREESEEKEIRGKDGVDEDEGCCTEKCKIDKTCKP